MTETQESTVDTGVDPIVVGVVGNRLFSLVNEQQTALVNTAFSSVVRESLDLACAVFDSTGRMIAQSVGGTPGHINAMATGMAHIVAKYPADQLSDGDVLLTNDPWLTAGQINDITVATPVFAGGRPVAWFASCCHSPDIGGRILSAAATEVFEEGLRLPIMKFLLAGEPNRDLVDIIRANVRTPDETIGDIYAQISGNEVGARSLRKLMAEFDLPDIDAITTEITARSERALREAITEIADGTYESELHTDGFGDETLLLKAAIRVAGDEIFIDFAGSSPQSQYGVNVVLNYTTAYASFAIKAAIAPGVPHNAGSFRPVHVTAPVGSLLNCQPPAPVASRHLVGHFLPSLLFTALAKAMPGRLIASSADALWMNVWRGHATGDAPHSPGFTLTSFHAGGSGGRATSDGLPSTGFPTGVRATPTEVIETLTPLVQHYRALRPDSAGAGLFRGGLGQRFAFSCRTDRSWTVNANVDRTRFPAEGLAGGTSGQPGSFSSPDGEALPRKQRVSLNASDATVFELPGGGGYGNPYDRDPESVLTDVVDGYLTIDTARTQYGVAITYVGSPDALVRPPSAYRLDCETTTELRADNLNHPET